MPSLPPHEHFLLPACSQFHSPELLATDGYLQHHRWEIASSNPDGAVSIVYPIIAQCCTFLQLKGTLAPRKKKKKSRVL